MKKIGITLIVIFLCITFNIAQGTISRKDSEPTVETTNNNNLDTLSERDSLNVQTTKASLQNEGQQSEAYENLENEIKEVKSLVKTWKIIVYGLFGFLILLIAFIYFLYVSGKFRDYLIHQVLEDKSINKRFKPTETKSNALTPNDINTIAEIVFNYKLQNEKKIQQQSKIRLEDPKPKTRYLKGKSGKMFNRVDNSPENSFFKLTDENDDTAQFEFCGDDGEAIAKRIFSEDICNIISGSYQNAISVKTSKAGKIRRIGDQWEVTEPVEIKLD